MTKQSIHDGNSFFCREEIKKNLKGKTLQSAFIRLLSNGTSFALSMVSTIVLARLLAPEEFGLLAMVTAVTEFARSIRELGLGTATVQRENVNQNEVSMLFWINVSMGTAIMLILICLSPLLVWFYGDSRLLYICIVMSSVFFFGGLSVQHRALLERQMRFGALGTINVIATILSVCVCVFLALGKFGVWALVFRDIIFAVLYGAGVWLFCGWIPSTPKWKSGVKSSLKFGVDVSGLEIVQYFTRNIDQVLIGRFCGASSLGLYSKAFQLAMMPIGQIQGIFWDIGFSPLSTLQSDPKRFRRFYSRLLSVMTLIYMPFVVFIVVQAEDIIRLLLGESWLSAAPIFRIIAVAAFFKPVVGTFQLVMITCNQTRRCIKWAVMNSVIAIIAFAIGIYWGSIGVAYGHVVAGFVTMGWSLMYCFTYTPVNAFFIVKNISLSVISSCGAGMILIALQSQMPYTSMLAGFVAAIVVFAAVFLGILFCVPQGRNKLAEYWSYRAGLFNRA